ncbi:hypothetical protein [Pseudactinotalea sp.]|uniref:hypothetical protein n=1 Tax=Pseudactinotalea sp. TaxID=1926260 RepID=UPI003B3A6D39
MATVAQVDGEVGKMEEQEKSPTEQRAALKRQTEGALLQAIKSRAEKTPTPDLLKTLAEAYALVMSNKAPEDKSSEGGSKPGGQRFL